MANSVDPEQTAPLGAVCSGSTLFASILNSSVMLGSYFSRRLQQTTFSDAFFLGALRINSGVTYQHRRKMEFKVVYFPLTHLSQMEFPYLSNGRLYLNVFGFFVVFSFFFLN